MPEKRLPGDPLTPHFDLLQEEYLLIQAWKKTVSYIRRHNWYVDTMQLDRTAIDLRSFIENLQNRIKAPDWENSRLRIVLAPKSKRWEKTSKDPASWKPVKEKDKPAVPLRPLAQVDIEEQVVATALMLCLANRVETEQGDPRDEIRDTVTGRTVISYGNRLFCTRINGELRHRWGSAKLYRAYYQDYKKFISRPDSIVKSIESRRASGEIGIFVVHSDLKQFYDRVRPHHLADALQRLKKDDDEQPFFDFAKQVLSWTWDPRDKTEMDLYAKQTQIEGFERIALPQGLVSSGFFANVVLLEFDRRLQETIGEDIAKDLRLEDACRYVDDLRITLASHHSRDPAHVKDAVTSWLQPLLASVVPGLEINADKTEASQADRSGNPLIKQSTKMNRIQSAISGGFDAIGGIEILDSIQNLMHAQEALPQKPEEATWQFSPIPDVRKATVARFTAVRYRTTYRSIRPLLLSEEESPAIVDKSRPDATVDRNDLDIGTQRKLDEDMRAFALGLIERWVADPSNVRLLRIGFDLYPDSKILREVLDMLSPQVHKWRASRHVAWYCLSELFRAGAIETGWVEDEEESMLSALRVGQYREELRAAATEVAQSAYTSLPWYLRQQALLFLAVCSPSKRVTISRRNQRETKHYAEIIEFSQLGKVRPRILDPEFAILAVLAHRSFPNREETTRIILRELTPSRASAITARDPSFARYLVTHKDCPFSAQLPPAHAKRDLCLEESVLPRDGMRSLEDIVLRSDQRPNVLRNELAVLRFAEKFLRQLNKVPMAHRIITPRQVRVKVKALDGRVAKIRRLEIDFDSSPLLSSLYQPPGWCAEDECWRFNLGYLIRFILTEQPDFTRSIFPSIHWRERTSTYRKAENHWYQRLHGLFNGQQAFGGDWVPVTDWMEKFLLTLLRWPGCHLSKTFKCIDRGLSPTLEKIKSRVRKLTDAMGDSSETQLLTIKAERNRSRPGHVLRVCVVQTAVPELKDFQKGDLALSARSIRKKHRNHLSVALAAVKGLMKLRNTYTKYGGGLDWLILPELAVHPKDVKTHLMPFARAYKTLILAGVTYEKLLENEKLPSNQAFQNSAIWILPAYSKDAELQLRTRRQGKQYLSPAEEKLSSGLGYVQGFRPCQWLVKYPWSKFPGDRPLRLAGSICYDATDLGIVTTLRNQSDILAIPSLNQDVKTFNQMALALNYHMFQLVIVANSGQYGGSNAYWPAARSFRRQIFHLHGRLQASVVFFEIDDIRKFQNRVRLGDCNWKYPPAGFP